MEPIYYDTETCGLHGPVVLIQYAVGGGEIHLHNVWYESVASTVKLIEWMMNHEGGVVGFNLAFDHFHLCQLYTTLIRLKSDWDDPPEIEEYALNEADARFGPCLKPVTALDLMLHARKGPYQSTMDREDIRIKRVPTALAWQLAAELEKRVPLKDIYFARKKDKHAQHWQVADIKDDFGDVQTDFKDILLKFAPSSALKALATDALNLPPDTTLLFADVEVDRNLRPKEYGYAPFATSIGSPEDWKGTWPDVIRFHITHWQYNSLARKYAAKDVEYTRDMHKFFGSPKTGDTDSILACLVGAVRWRGFAVDPEGIRKLRVEAISRSKLAPTAPARVKQWIYEVLDETEKVVVRTTKKTILEEIAKWKVDCPACGGKGVVDEVIVDGELVGHECPTCEGSCEAPHAAALRAQAVIDARGAQKETELYDKLLLAGRFHASFKVIGALSSRMSGTDDLNPQGIKREGYVRECFPLADLGLELCGGDFDSFEVALAEADYKDEKLREMLLSETDCHKCDGTGANAVGTCKECKGTGRVKQKIHALFAMELFPPITYNEVMKDKEKYTRGKSGVFAMIYGGTPETLKNKLGVDLEIAEKAYTGFGKRYPGVAKARVAIFDMFCSMRQPNGIGTKVEWHEPVDYIESMLGFRRYFTLENRIAKALFELSTDPPKPWLAIKFKVVRRDREQTAVGSVRSALYACAFAIQAANMRAAANHRIQSTGAGITKELQVAIWSHQPCGVHVWVVEPCNIHDEVMTPTDPKIKHEVKETVRKIVESFRPLVPMIEMEWKLGMKSWASK